MLSTIKFRITNHARQRFHERVIADNSQHPPRDIDTLICRDVYSAKEMREYMTIPRFILWLYEKYNGTQHLAVYESEKVIYLTKFDKESGLRMIITCWLKATDRYFTKDGIFRNSALSNKEVYLKISIFKARKR